MSWLAGYRYRKSIPLTGATGAGTYYQVPLTVHSAGGIDVGPAAIDMSQANAGGYTTINKENPADASGVITSVDIWAHTSLSSCKVGIFTETATNQFKCRSSHTIGTVTAGSRKTFSGLSLAVQVGDYIGLYHDAGTIDAEDEGGEGIWYIANDHCIVDDESTYTAVAGDTISVSSSVECDGIVYLRDLCTDFPNDIRFTDNDGATELDYWIEDETADPAKFWIEVKDSLESGQTPDIYIYYGKSGASSASIDFSENFLDYTEVDPNNHITPTGDPSHHIDFDAYRNEDAYLYKDKGADYFSDFEHLITVNPVSASDNYAYGFPWLLANAVGDYVTLDHANESVISVFLSRETSATQPRFQIVETYEGEWSHHYDSYDAPSFNTKYYLVIKKVGTAFTCKIYSDEARETLLDTLSITLEVDYKFRYIYSANTFHNDTVHEDIDIDNLFMRFIVDPEPSVGTPGSEQDRHGARWHHYKMLAEA